MYMETSTVYCLKVFNRFPVVLLLFTKAVKQQGNAKALRPVHIERLRRNFQFDFYIYRNNKFPLASLFNYRSRFPRFKNILAGLIKKIRVII